MPTQDHGWRPELIRLLTTASDVLNKHTNQDERCAVCGTEWPCERAVLAEHNLAAL